MMQTMSFTDLKMPPELVAALARQQITEPTPIQSAALPVLAEGKDAYLHAERGTGKTLAIQIHRQSCDLAQNAGMALRSVLLIGGTATDLQIERLKKKPHLVVGSPGVSENRSPGASSRHVRVIRATLAPVKFATEPAMQWRRPAAPPGPHHWRRPAVPLRRADHPDAAQVRRAQQT